MDTKKQHKQSPKTIPYKLYRLRLEIRKGTLTFVTSYNYLPASSWDLYRKGGRQARRTLSNFPVGISANLPKKILGPINLQPSCVLVHQVSAAIRIRIGTFNDNGCRFIRHVLSSCVGHYGLNGLY